MAAAQAAEVEHRPAHQVEQRAHAGQVGRIPTGHEHQVALGRTPGRARHRRVDHARTACGQRLRGGLGQPGLGRRAIQQQRAGPQAVDQTVITPRCAQHHLLHHAAVGQHGDHDVAGRRHLGGRGHRLRTAAQLGRHRAGAGGVGIEQRQAVAGAGQVAGHGRAHHAQADESEGQGGVGSRHAQGFRSGLAGRHAVCPRARPQACTAPGQSACRRHDSRRPPWRGRSPVHRPRRRSPSPACHFRP